MVNVEHGNRRPAWTGATSAMTAARNFMLEVDLFWKVFFSQYKAEVLKKC